MAMSEADFIGLANRARKAQQAINDLGAGPGSEDRSAVADHQRWVAAVQNAPEGSIVIPAVLTRISEHEIHLSFPTLAGGMDIDVPLSDEQYDRLNDALPAAPPL